MALVFGLVLFTLIVLKPCFSVGKANSVYLFQDSYERVRAISSSSPFPVHGGLQTVSVGVYPGGLDVDKYEAQLDVKFDYVLQLQEARARKIGDLTIQMAQVIQSNIRIIIPGSMLRNRAGQGLRKAFPPLDSLFPKLREGDVGDMFC